MGASEAGEGLALGREALLHENISLCAVLTRAVIPLDLRGRRVQGRFGSGCEVTIETRVLVLGLYFKKTILMIILEK